MPQPISKAGDVMGRAIVRMVHLICQNDTAEQFYTALYKTICTEMKQRGIDPGSIGGPIVKHPYPPGDAILTTLAPASPAQSDVQRLIARGKLIKWR